MNIRDEDERTSRSSRGSRPSITTLVNIVEEAFKNHDSVLIDSDKNIKHKHQYLLKKHFLLSS